MGDPLDGVDKQFIERNLFNWLKARYASMDLEKPKLLLGSRMLINSLQSDLVRGEDAKTAPGSAAESQPLPPRGTTQPGASRNPCPRNAFA